MNNPEKPAPSTRRKKLLIRSLLSLFVLISLAVLLTAYENWSGAREWERVRKILFTEGVELNPQALVPPLPAANQNFFAHPLLSSQSDFELDAEENVVYRNQKKVDQFWEMQIPRIRNPRSPFPGWEDRRNPEFSAIAEVLELDLSNPSQSLADWFAQFESELNEIDRAAQRPESVLDFELPGGFIELISHPIPYASSLQKHLKFQSIRACLALERGDTPEAKHAIRTMLQISRGLGSQPALLSHLVATSGHNLTLSVIWYGLENSYWNETDLRWLIEELEGKSTELFESLETAMNFELCVATIGACDFLKTPEAREVDLFRSIIEETHSKKGNHWLALVPRGIWDHNKAFGAELLLKSALIPARERTSHVPPFNFSEIRRTPRNFLTLVTTPAFTTVRIRTAHTTAATDMARIACALECYHAAKGNYPNELSSLYPDYLPSKEIDPGSPEKETYRYLPMENRYQIYSLGANGTDDGGKTEIKAGQQKKIDIQVGDWVWGYSEETQPN